MSLIIRYSDIFTKLPFVECAKRRCCRCTFLAAVEADVAEARVDQHVGLELREVPRDGAPELTNGSRMGYLARSLYLSTG